MTLRLYWKITVETINGEIRVFKDISLWKQEETAEVLPTATQVRHETKELEYYIMDESNKKLKHYLPDHRRRKRRIKRYLKNAHHKLSVDQEGWIRFNGAYLKIIDPGIESQVNWSGVVDGYTQTRELSKKLFAGNASKGGEVIGNLDEKGLTGKLEPFRGLNVRIEALLDPQGTQSQPVFWFPQECNNNSNKAILLMEKIPEDKTTVLNWVISKNKYETRKIMAKDKHQVSISLDQDQGGGNKRFEFHLDAMPLALENGINEASDNHHIELGERQFYVGYYKECDVTEIFNGGIKRIMFDPNSSCGGCV